MRWCMRVRAAYVVAYVLGQHTSVHTCDSIRRCIRVGEAYVGAYL
jgi:hypothetical protein